MNEKQKFTWDDIKEMFAENARQFKETDQRLDKMFAKNGQRLEKLEKLVGGIANSNGEMAEEYFFHVFRRERTFVNEKFDKIRGRFCYRNENNEVEAEYDIFLFNGKSTALIEVKYNAKPENVNVDNLISRAKLFRTHYPEYKNHNIYLGIAAMAFKKNLVEELHQAGIATIHQMGKKMVVYDKDVKVF